jgi:hypothetical protein
MNLKEFVSGNSVSVEFVKQSATKKLKIISTGEIRKFENQEKVCFLVEIDGERLEYYPNRSSLRNLSERWGIESQAWIGREASLTIANLNGWDMVIAMPL